MRQQTVRTSRHSTPDVWTLFDTSWAAESTLDAYLTVVLDRCADWFKASGASLFLLQEGTSRYLLAANAGRESSVPDGATIVSGEGIAGTCVVTKQPILVENPLTHPSLSRSVKKRNSRLGSSMVVPLLTPDGDCIGVLNLSRSLEEFEFSRDDLRTAGSLAGHIALAVANGRLLSKLRLAVAEATKLHAKLDTILSSLAVAIIVVESAGKIIHANPEALAMAENARVLEQPLAEFASRLPDFLASAVRQIAAQSLAGNRGSSVARDEATGKAFSLTGSPLSGGGATLAIQDTTEHEQVMREISRVRRLAEIGQMTAAIAHEIRNPLWAMRGAAQVIQSDPEHAQEFGQIIEEEVVKLAELCNGFLDFARPLELHCSHFSLAEVVRRICSQHQGEFDEAGVNLEFSADESGGEVCADRNRVEQVARNLILNAMQACKKGDTVRVHCANGVLSVGDSGSGMEQTVLEKLFTPFFTTKPQGTGLGLSTVRKIVDAHGGTISVASKAGKGTELTVDWIGKVA